MKLMEIMNLHAYFISLIPPLSEPAKEILREIEEHILSVIQKERHPTQTNPAHSQPIQNQTESTQYDRFGA